MAEELEKKRLTELAARSWNQGIFCFTHFLDLAGLSLFHSLVPSLPPVAWTLFGGAEGCERQMLRFGDAQSCGYEAPFPIVCLKITPAAPKYAEKLTHRDYLGALMALGIERETLGDIAVKKDAAYLFCESHIAPYVAEHFTQARHTALTVQEAEHLPGGALFETERRMVQLSSQRIDALIAHVYKMSRSEAQALFPAGRVYVSGRLCESPGYSPKAGDILSVRGYGRIRYIGLESLSKKGKENTAVEIYI